LAARRKATGSSPSARREIFIREGAKTRGVRADRRRHAQGQQAPPSRASGGASRHAGDPHHLHSALPWTGVASARTRGKPVSAQLAKADPLAARREVHGSPGSGRSRVASSGPVLQQLPREKNRARRAPRRPKRTTDRLNRKRRDGGWNQRAPRS